MGIPLVAHAEHCGGFTIRLTFTDGADGIVDFEQWLEGPMFEPLKDPALFRRFVVEGGTVGWPNGADIAPETLYDAIHVARVSVVTSPTGR